MRLTPAHAAKLARLDNGESLPRSQIPKVLLHPLQEAGVVRLIRSGSSYVVRGVPDALARFVEHHWGVQDLSRYAEAAPEKRSRELLSEIAGDSKALPNRPLEGIFLRSFGKCYLREEPLGVAPQGSATLISLDSLPHLRIKTSVLIGIENPRCLWNFECARKYFPELKGLDFTLILRWHWGTAWRQWLAGWNGQILYFPDYDPAGLGIYAAEVLPHCPGARLLVPKDFERLLTERGDRKFYVTQEVRFPQQVNEEILSVMETLRKHRKGLEQESLLF